MQKAVGQRAKEITVWLHSPQRKLALLTQRKLLLERLRTLQVRHNVPAPAGYVAARGAAGAVIHRLEPA
jgi:inactivated superfamily I helicase